jgi:hypothetical protein
MSEPTNPGNVDLGAAPADRARALWAIMTAVEQFIDGDESAAFRRNAQRFLVEVAWYESARLTTRSIGDGRGLFQMAPRALADSFAYADRRGWIPSLATAAAVTEGDLRAAFAALGGAWPDGGLVESLLTNNDLVAALLARYAVKREPSPIPIGAADHADYWARVWHPSWDSDDARATAVSAFAAGAAELDAWFAPPSGLTIVENPTRRPLTQRDAAPRAIIIHTTGDTDLAKILRFYTAPDGLGPHYMIGYDGTIHRIADEKLIAYHCKIEAREAELYQQGWDVWSKWHYEGDDAIDVHQEFAGYRSWRDFWIARGKHSPLDLVTGAHPNTASIGVEMQQPEPGDLTVDIYLDAQYEALVKLVADVAARHNVPLDRDHLLGHYDCSPMRRSSAKGNWDPGERFSWTRLFAGLGVPAV